MKKFNSHHPFVLFLAILFFPNFSFVTAQSIQSTPFGPNPGSYVYSLNNLPAGVTSAFWVLGDGHFRTGLAINHHLVSNTNNLVQAYLLDPYKINPPSRIACGNCMLNGTSNSQNPTVAMGPGQYLKIGTSWNPIPGGVHYTILTFENTGSAPSGVVELNFLNNVSSIQVNAIENNSDWVSNVSINGNLVEFDFYNLPLGEQRHLLVQTEVDQLPSGDRLFYNAQMWTDEEGSIFELVDSSLIRKYPYDPNDKAVNIRKMCSYNIDPVTLEYTITFQNIGEDYATLVTIEDILPPELNYSTIQVLDSSDPYQYGTSGNKLEFIFDTIFLPGLDQTVPYIPLPDETIGYVTFSVETNICLPAGLIKNEATIIFDNLGPITTQVADTKIDYFEYCIIDPDACSNAPEPPKGGEPDKENGAPGDGAPEYGGSNCKGDSGIDGTFSDLDDKDYQFSVYPNPVNELLTVSFEPKDKEIQTIKLTIFDAQGTIITRLSEEFSVEKGKQKISINASTWPKGIYFVKLENANEIHPWKIIKQ